MSSAAANYGKGFVGFIKKWWDLKPEFVASAAIGIAGLGVGIHTIHKYEKYELDNRKYRKHYTVYRHDDPRVAKLRKD